MKKTLVNGCLRLALASLLLLSGCIVTSVYPFYTEESLRPEPKLLGLWRDAKEPDQTWEFAQAGQLAWTVTYCNGDSTNVMSGHVFVLKGEELLDVMGSVDLDEQCPPAIPSHTVFRLSITEGKVRLIPMSHEWLVKETSKHRNHTPHLVVARNDKGEAERIVLTGTTRQLQKFLGKHLQNKEAWEDAIELKRPE